MASSVVRSGAAQSVTKQAGGLVTRQVKPIQSVDNQDAKRRVLKTYKAWIRYVPEMLHFYQWTNRTSLETRNALKALFLENKSVADPRAIDILCHKSEIELANTKINYNQTCHLHSAIYKDHVEPKETDFLSKFLAGKD